MIVFQLLNPVKFTTVILGRHKSIGRSKKEKMFTRMCSFLLHVPETAETRFFFFFVPHKAHSPIVYLTFTCTIICGQVWINYWNHVHRQISSRDT